MIPVPAKILQPGTAWHLSRNMIHIQHMSHVDREELGSKGLRYKFYL